MDLVYFIVLVGALIFVHELGHFAWAKFFGVRVLRFSLGFGPRIASFRVGETEYRIAAFPLGGYVRLLGETPGDEIGKGEEARSFAAQAVWKRVLIVIAGPAMNMAFPLVLFFLVYLGDTRLPPSVIGTVFPGRPADGKLLPGDRVVEVDGDEVVSFHELSRKIAGSAGEPITFTIDRAGERLTEHVTPVSTRTLRELDRVEYVGRIGIMPHTPVAVIGVLGSGSPAAAAGLSTFDVVVSAAGQAVHRYGDFVRVVESTRANSLPMTYLRPTRLTNAIPGLVDLEVYEPHIATVTPEPGTGSVLHRMGIELADLYVHHVIPGSAEHAIGLERGDRLIALDGRPIRLWATLVDDLRAGEGRTHRLTFRRGDRLIEKELRLRRERGVDEFGQPYDRLQLGARNWVPMWIEPPVENPTPIRYALGQAFARTWEMVEVTALSVVRVLEGRLTVKSIGGPISIYDVAGTAAREGATNYLTLMAFISVNLGLINLLPIPLLDGGHLLFFLIEAVARRPIHVRVRQYAALAGLTLLILLMVIALKNDIERKWPRLADGIVAE